MNDINASIRLSNLPDMTEITRKGRENGRFYNKELENIQGVELFDSTDYRAQPVYWIYTLKVFDKEIY